VEAEAAAVAGSAAEAVVAGSAAGSATRARPQRSSVGATPSLPTRVRVFGPLLGCFFFLTLWWDFRLACAEVSTFLHACEGDAVTKLTIEKVPYFNAPIYLQNKTQVGKVDEIFGPINESVSTFSPP
jgi:hypothetical protein